MSDIVERLRKWKDPANIPEAADEIERLRAALERQNMLDSAPNDLRSFDESSGGKPMSNADQPSDFSADLVNMIGRYLEAGTTPDEIAAALQEAIEEIEGEALDDAGDEIVADVEGKPDDDEMQ